MRADSSCVARLRHRIVARPAPGTAAADAPRCKPRAPCCAMALNCFKRVRRATRLVATVPAEKWAQQEAVQVDRRFEQRLHRVACPIFCQSCSRLAKTPAFGAARAG